MAEASAKMHFREVCHEDDVNLAIKVMLDSFLEAQKMSVKQVLRKSFQQYISFNEDMNLLLMHHLCQLFCEAEKYKNVSTCIHFIDYMSNDRL